MEFGKECVWSDFQPLISYTRDMKFNMQPQKGPKCMENEEEKINEMGEYLDMIESAMVPLEYILFSYIQYNQLYYESLKARDILLKE